MTRTTVHEVGDARTVWLAACTARNTLRVEVEAGHASAGTVRAYLEAIQLEREAWAEMQATSDAYSAGK